MSTPTTATELNSAAPESNGSATATPRNRVRTVLNGTTKFRRLFDLSSREGQLRTFSIKRVFEGEGTIGCKLEGFPKSLDAAAVARHAAEHGLKERGTVAVGAAAGGWSCVKTGETASQTVKELTEE